MFQLVRSLEPGTYRVSDRRTMSENAITRGEELRAVSGRHGTNRAKAKDNFLFIFEILIGCESNL